MRAHRKFIFINKLASKLADSAFRAHNPCRPNDRLLLGMKGSISEFELGVLRARMLDAARSKAGRGELRLSVPFGYIWHREAGLGLDPDLRLQQGRSTLSTESRVQQLSRS